MSATRVLSPIVAATLLALAACPGPSPDFIECRDDMSCYEGGRCLVNSATGHQFCAYPDSECPSGMRWSDLDVEGNISGTCVIDEPGVDAAVDVPTDAGIDGSSEPSEFASCVGLVSTCGPNANQDCCSTSVVPAGSFYRSVDEALDAYNDRNYPATVSEFRLDRYEVTVGRFRKFVQAGRGIRSNPPAANSGAHPQLPGSGWNASWNSDLAADTATLVAALKCDVTYETWTDAPGSNESRPVNCVSWYDAMAFCIWDGGYLPTEAEWNFAAAGGDEQRVFPWSRPANSTTIDCSYANYWNGQNCVAAGPTRVGSSPLGDGRWAHSDLAGNVSEWVLDTYAETYPLPCTDCAYLGPGTSRVARGGDYSFPAFGLRTAARLVIAQGATWRDKSLGFRCARPMP